MRATSILIGTSSLIYGGLADGGIRGISYKALPTKSLSAVVATNDMIQVGYKNQWGSTGRGDLQVMKNIGANAVRGYHSLGSEGVTDHSAFLDEAETLGMKVVAGFHTQGYCPDFDCYDSWKTAATHALKNGFAKDGAWHPAVSMVVLMDQPDYLNFIGGRDGSAPVCAVEDQPKCRTRAALSAMDGVLAAEKEAGIKGTANLTIAWSFALRSSIDNTVYGPGIYGFQDMVAGVASPAIAAYDKLRTPQADMQAAFDSRWTHAVNTGSPWSFINDQVGGKYAQFLPHPWVVLEFTAGSTGHSVSDDLTAMDSAASPDGPFLGVFFGQFQHDYVAATKYGMFGLGTKQLGMANPCYEDVLSGTKYCQNYFVYCLDPTTGDGDRASQVATAWGGKVAGAGLCASNATEIMV